MHQHAQALLLCHAPCSASYRYIRLSIVEVVFCALLLLLQIFVEIERARLTRKLAAMREAEGNIAEAADTLQEVAVVRRLAELNCTSSPSSR